MGLEKVIEGNKDSKFKFETLVVMGISTGGPKLLSEVIKGLDPKLSAAYIIVQHMPSGFTKSLAERLDSLTELHVKEAEHGEYLEHGTVYIAPGGFQLRVVNALKPHISLSDEMTYKGHKPAVNLMLLSISELVQFKKQLIVAIMTGMGCDGLEGVEALKKTHLCTVIAQDEASSTVYGMPKAIVNAGLADYIVSGAMVSQKIKEIVGDHHGC